MKEDEYIVPNGPFAGKKVKSASTTGIDKFGDIAEDFMRRIFDLGVNDYLITDESSLWDFALTADLSDVHRKIKQEFGLDSIDLKSERLIEVFGKLHEQREPGDR
jgi:hypothetical protein